MSNYLSKLRGFLYRWIIVIGIWSYSLAVDASESVVLSYRFLRETISVPELSTFAKTGELSSSLQAYLDMAGKQPEQLRTTLTQPISVNGIIVAPGRGPTL